MPLKSLHIENEDKFWRQELKYKLPSIMNIPVIKDEFKYSLSKLSIGVTENRYLNLNASNSFRALIIGRTGSGKSFLIHNIIDRFAKSGGCVFVVDIKGEYLSCAKPLQEKFHKFLRENEIPQGFEISSYYPRFLAKYSGYEIIKPFENYVELNIKKLNKFDFLSILEYVKDNEKILIERAFEKVDKINSFEGFLNLIKKENADGKIINSVLSKLLNLYRDSVFGEEFNFDISAMLKPGKINILNLKGLKSVGKFMNIINSFIALLLRQLYLAKEIENKLKDLSVLVVIDEIGIWFEHENISPASIEIGNILRRGRSLGISFIASDQIREKIAAMLFTQANLIFLPYNIEFNELKDIIKQTLPEEYDYPIPFNYKISEIYYDMKKYKSGNRDWLMIDKDNQRYVIFTPLSPLSWHLEEGESIESILS